MKTLVVGATGLVGSETCRWLREEGHQLRCLVRQTADPAKRSALESLGAELAPGDLKDPASLAHACAGVQAVIFAHDQLKLAPTSEEWKSDHSPSGSMERRNITGPWVAQR